MCDRDDHRDVFLVVGQKVIAAGQGHERSSGIPLSAFVGICPRVVIIPGISNRMVKTDGFIRWGMKNQEGFPQARDGGSKVMASEILDHLTPDLKFLAADADGPLSEACDIRIHTYQQIRKMVRVARCGQSDDPSDAGNFSGHGQARCAAEAMPEEESRCLVLFGQELCCRLEILAVGGEVGFGKGSLACSQSAEVVSQHSPTAIGEPPRDAHDRLEVLVARKAVRKENPTVRFVVWKFTIGNFQDSGQIPASARKLNSVAFAHRLAHAQRQYSQNRTIKT